MNAIKELCKNCQHQRQAVNEPRNHRHCLVWQRLTFVNETCQHFQVAEGLLPSLDDVHSFLKNNYRIHKEVSDKEMAKRGKSAISYAVSKLFRLDAVQERTAKSKLQLP